MGMEKGFQAVETNFNQVVAATVVPDSAFPPFEFENWAVIALGTSRTRCRWATWAAASSSVIV
jgi:type II secretory pathway component PulL